MKLRIAVFAAGLALGVLWFLGPVLQARTPASPSASAPASGPLAHAVFAGGCFWCLEASLEKVPGVVTAVSGYAGGRVKNPSYEQVSEGITGHAESVQVAYDPARLSYEQLLAAFWHNVDPTDRAGQFCDRGQQYRTAIFTEGEAQKRAAEQSKSALETSKRLGAPIVTEIVPLEAFYPAEDYHQDFYKKSPVRYTTYRAGCGRDRRLAQLWGQDAGHVGAVVTGSRRNGRRERLDGRERRKLDEAGEGRAREEAHASAVQGDAAGGDGAGVQQRVLGQPRARDLRGRGLGRAAVLVARQVRLGLGLAELHPTDRARRTWRRSATPRSAWSASRCARSTPTPTSATSSTTARNPRASATASTRPPSASSPWRSWKRRATPSTRSSSPRPPASDSVGDPGGSGGRGRPQIKKRKQ